jgi:hypothetical protein
MRLSFSVAEVAGGKISESVHCQFEPHEMEIIRSHGVMPVMLHTVKTSFLVCLSPVYSEMIPSPQPHTFDAKKECLHPV